MGSTEIEEDVLKDSYESLKNLKKKARTEKIANRDKILDYKVCSFSKNTEELNSYLIGDLSFIKAPFGN